MLLPLLTITLFNPIVTGRIKDMDKVECFSTCTNDYLKNHTDFITESVPDETSTNETSPTSRILIALCIVFKANRECMAECDDSWKVSPRYEQLEHIACNGGLTSGSECSNEEIIKCDKKCGSQKGLAGESAETMFQLHMTKKGLEVELIPNPKISCEYGNCLFPCLKEHTESDCNMQTYSAVEGYQLAISIAKIPYLKDMYKWPSVCEEALAYNYDKPSFQKRGPADGPGAVMVVRTPRNAPGATYLLSAPLFAISIMSHLY